MTSSVIHDVLGQGRHGTVFLASGEHAPVAIKVAIDGGSLEHEANALERFAHPHVVTILDRTEEAIVIEYCESGTLADRMRFAPSLAADLRSQILGVIDAVQAMHDAGWIHGDITPANIGIRRDGSSALLDFSTARCADGQPLLQGTAQFAGALRTATTAVDVRCIAATARAALGTPDRWDVAGIAIIARLDDVIARIDSTQATATETGSEVAAVPVELSELRAIVQGLADAPVLDTEEIFATTPRSSGGRTSPPTRDYGPRPGEPDDEPSNAAHPVALTRVLGLAATLAAAALAATLVVTWVAGRPAATDPPRGELAIMTTIDAQTTLDDAAAQWTNGTLIRADDGGGSAWSVGKPGDLAAIADWDCDGTATLGVLRPATMTWFAFDSWDAGSNSNVRIIGEPNVAAVRLAVELDETGCARPLVVR